MNINIYDEKVYLKPDEIVLNMLQEIRNNEFIKPYQKEASLYKDIFNEYDNFIRKVVKLLNELDLKNSIEYSLALNYLIQSGYLSNNLKFNRKEASNELCSNFGINIIMGQGVCRNFSAFHKSVMETLGKYVKSFYCVDSFSIAKARTMKANHVLNLIKYEDSLYGFDLYNHNKLYKFVNPFMLEEISHYSGSKLRYKPYYEFFTSGVSLSIIKSQLYEFKNDIKKRHISAFEYYDTLYIQVFRNLIKYKDLYIDFHNETKNIKENIFVGMSKRLIKN